MSVRYSVPSSPWPNELIEWPDSSSRRGDCVGGPFAVNAQDLWRYTFATQILETYDFTRAIQVAMREYAPDRIILLGPGDTLGGAIVQALIAIEWRGLKSKQDFQELQASAPILLSMGRGDQRAMVTG